MVTLLISLHLQSILQDIKMATSACFLVLFDFCYFVVGGDGDAGLLLLQLPIFFLCSVLQLLCAKESLLFSPVYLFSKILVAWYHLLLSLGKFSSVISLKISSGTLTWVSSSSSVPIILDLVFSYCLRFLACFSSEDV